MRWNSHVRILWSFIGRTGCFLIEDQTSHNFNSSYRRSADLPTKDHVIFSQEMRWYSHRSCADQRRPVESSHRRSVRFFRKYQMIVSQKIRSSAHGRSGISLTERQLIFSQKIRWSLNRRSGDFLTENQSDLFTSDLPTKHNVIYSSSLLRWQWFSRRSLANFFNIYLLLSIWRFS